QLRKDLESAYDSRPATLAAAQTWLIRLARSAAEVAASLDGLPAAAPQSDAQWWAQALTRQCRSALDELTLLAPWLALPTASGRLREVLDTIEIPTLRELATIEAPWLAAIERVPEATPEERECLYALRRHVAAASGHARERIAAVGRLALQATGLASMEYDFLYDKGRHLLAIGYNVGEHRQDSSYYDLLASEARLCSFVAIAQGQLPQESWFALGRLLTTTGGEPMLMSWSGSMFEYLMPLLVMPTYENTLLDRWSDRSCMGSSAAQRGASRNAATTLSTFISTTSTAHSACPAWGSSADSPRIW
ncbi:MAG: ndvB 2, partial [Steroidobacteraceae bacterium]|nr:ndvB 2 [Steroidobacteraceae bacterium]